jgi:hypothetical protein
MFIALLNHTHANTTQANVVKLHRPMLIAPKDPQQELMKTTPAFAGRLQKNRV